MLITSYSVSKCNNEAMVIDNLKDAIHKTNDTTSLLIHSDQGILYQANEFRKLLEENNIEQSMSRRGNCYDNAVIESFFATLKCEFVYINKFKNIEQFKYDIELKAMDLHLYRKENYLKWFSTKFLGKFSYYNYFYFYIYYQVVIAFFNKK